MGEVDYAPGEPRGTNWHPHRGFETVTYIMDGAFLHQDSHGGGGSIENGATQWMTAGSGILHIETPPEELVISGGRFHGLQLWVNLPSRDKMIAPRYQNLDGELVTLLSSPDGGALVRLIAGDLAGHRGPGLDPHADRRGPLSPCLRERRSRSRGSVTSTPSPTCSPDAVRPAPRLPRCSSASSPCSVPATRSR